MSEEESRKEADHKKEIAAYKIERSLLSDAYFQLKETARKLGQSEKLSRESADKFSAAFNSSPDLMAITRVSDGKILEVNDGYTRMLGYLHDESVGKTTAELSIWANPADRDTFIAALKKDGQVLDFETELRRKDGTTVTVIDSARTFDLQGEACILSTAHDITDRKKAEMENLRKNRVLQMLSAINQALIHATDEGSLLSETCRIVGEIGGYRMLWIGFKEKDEAKTVRPVARAGFESGYLELAHITWADTEYGRGPIGAVIRTGSTVIVPDIAKEALKAPWHTWALERGYKSIIVLPFKSGGETFGALSIYADKTDAFSADEIAILEELAGDLSFGITSLRIDAERKMVAEELKASEEKYSTLVEKGNDGIIIIRRDGNLVYVNTVISNLSGYSREESLGTPFLNYIAPECRDLVEERYKQRMQGVDVPNRYDAEMVSKAGKRTPIEINASLITYEGKPATMAIIRDITERKMAEKALRASAEELKKFQMAVEAASDHIILTDDKGTIIYANKDTGNLTGYAREEVIGKNASLWGGQMPREFYEKMWKTIRDEKKPFKSEVINRRKNGELYNADLIISPVLGESGEVKYFVGVERDVSESKRLANDLTKFKLALDNASDQVTITDPDGIVVYANAAVEKVTGYTPAEALGKKSGSLWKVPMPLEYYQNLWRTIKEEKKTFVGEIQNRRKNGESYIAMIGISPVLDKEGSIMFFVGIERDITKEKEIDRAKSEFISLASHQLRTPLTTISWYTEMLLGGDAGALNEKQTQYFNEIYSAGRQMNEIIKSFLHILRLETGSVAMKAVQIDPVALVKTILDETRLAIDKKHLHVTEHYQDSLRQFSADADLIRTVLQNLISNAAKYSAEGGELEISLTAAREGSVVAGKTVLSDSIIVSVRDTGIGILEGDKEKIFTKFFRAENAKRLDPNGNGLGLYMAKFMVGIVGGDIWFDSEVGKGTTFYLLLPIAGKKADILR